MPSPELAELIASAPTHAQGRGGNMIHPISPREWEMIARQLAAGGFDSQMPVLNELPVPPALPTMRKRPDGAMEIHLDPKAGRDA